MDKEILEILLFFPFKSFCGLNPFSGVNVWAWSIFASVLFAISSFIVLYLFRIENWLKVLLREVKVFVGLIVSGIVVIILNCLIITLLLGQFIVKQHILYYLTEWVICLLIIEILSFHVIIGCRVFDIYRKRDWAKLIIFNLRNFYILIIAYNNLFYLLYLLNYMIIFF